MSGGYPSPVKEERMENPPECDTAVSSLNPAVPPITLDEARNDETEWPTRRQSVIDYQPRELPSVQDMLMNLINNPYNSTQEQPTRRTLKGCCYEQLTHYLPIIRWAPKYNLQWFRKDFIAGLTVGILLIPQSMAYALLAGLPPIYGMYSSTIPLFVFSIFSSSTQCAIGPVAPTCIMIASAVKTITNAPEMSTEYIGIALSLTFVAGIIQIFMGFAKLGFVTRLLSKPVMAGFIMGAAFIILVNQFENLLGLDMDRTLFFYSTLVRVLIALPTINWPTTGISVFAIVTLMIPKWTDKIPKWFPVPLLLMVVSTAISFGAQLESVGVRIVGDVPSGVPGFGTPSMDNLLNYFVGALTVSVVSYMGSVALAISFGQRQQEKLKKTRAEHPNFPLIDSSVDSNQEFIAYGLASLFGSFFSAHPVSASFSRTALNFEMDAVSQGSSVVQGGLLLICLAALTTLLQPLPRCVLSSVIAISVRRLILSGIEEGKMLWKVSRADFIQFAVAFIGVLFLGLELGLAFAVGSSICIMIYRNAQAAIVELGQCCVNEQVAYLEIGKFDGVSRVRNITILELEGSLSFMNTKRVMQFVSDLNDRNKFVIISLSHTEIVDTSAIREIETLVKPGVSQHHIVFANCKPSVQDVAFRYTIQNTHFFTSIHEAVLYCNRRMEDFDSPEIAEDEDEEDDDEPASPTSIVALKQ